MSFADIETKITQVKTQHKITIPTRVEIKDAIAWVVENFPYVVSPSRNPGQGEAIQKWLDENIGPMDDKWTWLDKEIRFRTQEDYVLYGLTWQKFGEDENNAYYS